MERKSRPSPLSFSSRDASVSSLSDSCASSASAQNNKGGRRSPSPRQQQQQPTTPRSPSSRSASSRGCSPTCCVSPNGGFSQPPTTGLAYLASRRSSVSSTTTTTCPSSPNAAGQQQQQRYSSSSRRQSNFLELPEIGSPGNNNNGGRRNRTGGGRVNSLPVGMMQSAELYRLRSFHITGNNRVVNCGDSFIPLESSNNTGGGATSPFRSLSRTSTTATTPKQGLSPRSSGRSPLGSSCCGSDVSSCVDSSDDDDDVDNHHMIDSTNSGGGPLKGYYRVVLLGASKVGKSALVEQFMTSEYINTYDASLDDDFGERRVSVLLDSLESELIFIDHPSCEMSAENSLSTYGPAGVIVVYSVTDLESYRVAGDILRYLWQEGLTHDKAVILVGNKCDLERARVVSSQEGKTLASSYESKFIETSSGIQHNVDELLVGTLKQCRLRDPRRNSSSDSNILNTNNKSKKKKKRRRSRSGRRSAALFSLHDLARELLGKLVFYSSFANARDNTNASNLTVARRSRSCENLYVL